MPLVVGVSFKKAGKVYYFDPSGIDLHEGDFVIAETARGIEFGEIMSEPKEVSEEEIVSPLKKVVRKASSADIQREENNKQREKSAYHTCQQKIQLHNLPMKLIEAEYCFDGSQVTFYFSAESRVDFRELVKDLAGSLRTKVQLHQVGVRDEAKLFGGLGPCGRPMCCASFLNGFEPVSMKMAKEQSLFLNPLKFSGICGKLMCCLKYEYPTYKAAKERLPKLGTMVDTPGGSAKLVEIHVIKEVVGVEMPDGSVVRYPAAELFPEMAEPLCGGCCGKNSATCSAEACTAVANEPADEAILESPVIEVLTAKEVDIDTLTESDLPEPVVTQVEKSTTEGERRNPSRRRNRPFKRPHTGEQNTQNDQPAQTQQSPTDQAQNNAPESHAGQGGSTRRRRPNRRRRKPSTGGNGENPGTSQPGTE